MRKKTKQAIGATVAIIAIIVAVGLAVFYWPKPGSSVTPQAFDIKLYDGIRSDEELELSDFTASFWMFPDDGTDAEDWSQWEQNLDVDQLSDIDDDTFEAGYTRFVVFYNGTTDTSDTDDVVYESTAQRQAEIYADRVNTLYSYETPNAGAWLMVWNCTGDYIDITTDDMDANENFSIMAMLNFTQTYAGYKGFWDFTSNDWARLTYTVTFNATCNAAELSGSGGLVRTHPTATTLQFAWDFLGQAPTIHNFLWKASPSDIVVDATTPIALAFAGVAV